MTVGATGAGFATEVLAFGLLLTAGALLAGLARRSFLSMTALFVLAGFVLGEGGLEVLTFDPESGFVADLAIVALIVILFRDGIEVEAEMLQREWRLPFRKLVLAMPLTGALVALVTKALTDLSCSFGPGVTGPAPPRKAGWGRPPPDPPVRRRADGRQRGRRGRPGRRASRHPMFDIHLRSYAQPAGTPSWRRPIG